MINFNVLNSTDKLLELGCGNNPHPQCHVHVDKRFIDGVTDFQVDMEEDKWPIGDEDFDGVFSHFALEHVSWRKVPNAIREMFRILKPGGRVGCAVPNTASQINWLLEHQEGWDGKNLYESASCVLFGDADYPDNCHKAYFDVNIAHELFSAAGFEQINVRPYGERDTDMYIEAVKPLLRKQGSAAPTSWGDDESVEVCGSKGPGGVTCVLPKGHEGKHEANAPRSLTVEDVQPIHRTKPTQVAPKTGPGHTAGRNPPLTQVGESMSPEEMYDKHYFNGGQKVGGYANDQWGAFRDFPVHEVTAAQVLHRQPKSALELGCARGYILKRLQDAGIHGEGLEVSKHCYLTRVCDGIQNVDMCKPWPIDRDDNKTGFDLCYSVAVLEHIPEQHLQNVIQEMARTCQRGLHGIDFGHNDDGFDKTHCTLKPRNWWQQVFEAFAPGWPVEIVDKEDLESPKELPRRVREGDGKLKVNIGSYTVMHHYGWVNVDIHDLNPYAQHNGYKFHKADVTAGMDFLKTGTVDLIMTSHFLEHLTYDQGLTFLKECRRALKPKTGAMRVAVPDAALLISKLGDDQFWKDMEEINDDIAKLPTHAAKLHALLYGPEHKSVYDWQTLERILKAAGFHPWKMAFREAANATTKQIVKETLDNFPCLSLFVDAMAV